MLHSEQEVIVNDFDGRNDCALNDELFENFNGSASLSENELAHLYRLKMLNHATALISHPYPLNGCESATIYQRGSGTATLTSSSRYVTNHHNVKDYRYTSIDLFRARAGHLDLANSTDFISYPGVGFKKEPLLTDRVWCPAQPEGDMYEDPFLANRLFSLGLHTWSQKAKNETVRAHLRESSIRIDDVGATQKFVTQTSPGQYEGRDIAVVMHDAFPINDEFDREGTNSGSPLYLDSGPFYLQNRGPFATRVSATSFLIGADLNVETTHDPFYSLNLHLYPESSTENRAPFVSTGYRDETSNGVSDNTSCLAEPLGSRNRRVVDISYTENIKVTNDATLGTSGTALLGVDTHFEDGQDYRHDWYPVIKGLIRGGERTEGGPAPTGQWHEERRTMLDEEHGQENFEEDVNIAVLFEEDDIPWLTREPDYGSSGAPGSPGDPFNPAPAQPLDDGCPGDVEDGECYARVTLGTQTGNAYPGAAKDPGYSVTFPVGTSSSGSSQGSGGSGGGPSTNAWEEFQDRLRASRYSLVYCQGEGGKIIRNRMGSSAKWHIRFGMMQGLTGSANEEFYQDHDPEARVAALSSVCIPWSSAPWLTNWSWAHIVNIGDSSTGFFQSRVLRGLHDVLLGSKIALWDYLQSVYERRKTEENEVYARPPSMMNCPPNYYLQGVLYHRTSTDDEAPMRGILALTCHVHEKAKAQRPSLPPILMRHLDAGDQQYKDLQGFSSMTSDGPRPYSLTQMIGESRSDQHEPSLVGGSECGQDEAAVGFIMRRNEQGAVNFFQLVCVGAPGGGP